MMITTLRLSIVAGCIILGGCGPASVQGPPIQQEPIGKFTLITARGASGFDTVYKVNTATGETWRLVVAGWQPVKEAP